MHVLQIELGDELLPQGLVPVHGLRQELQRLSGGYEGEHVVYYLLPVLRLVYHPLKVFAQVYHDGNDVLARAVVAVSVLAGAVDADAAVPPVLRGHLVLRCSAHGGVQLVPVYVRGENPSCRVVGLAPCVRLGIAYLPYCLLVGPRRPLLPGHGRLRRNFRYSAFGSAVPSRRGGPAKRRTGPSIPGSLRRPLSGSAPESPHGKLGRSGLAAPPKWADAGSHTCHRCTLDDAAASASLSQLRSSHRRGFLDVRRAPRFVAWAGAGPHGTGCPQEREPNLIRVCAPASLPGLHCALRYRGVAPTARKGQAAAGRGGITA